MPKTFEASGYRLLELNIGLYLDFGRVADGFRIRACSEYGISGQYAILQVDVQPTVGRVALRADDPGGTFETRYSTHGVAGKNLL